MPDRMAVRELSVAARSAELYVRVVGTGDSRQTLMLIHGGPGFSHQYLRELEQLASKELTVVSYDQRGCGQSTSAGQRLGDFDLAGYSHDLEAVRRAVTERPIHLLGHSWGGVVAMHYATRYPQHVRSLILIASPPASWRGMQEGGERFEARLKVLQQRGSVPLDLPSDPHEHARLVLPVYCSDAAISLPIFDVDISPTVGDLTITAIHGFDMTADVGRLDHPVLIVWGEDDPFGRQCADATKTALTNAQVELVVLSQCGHFGWLECPDKFFPPLRAFLGRMDQQPLE
jgi:pimeloyl-ACP methyl ester carboxylesterase